MSLVHKNHSGVRPNSVAVLGLQFGDEGKGRIVDNKIQELISRGLKKIYVVRSQGGNNAGHTVEKDKTRIGLHQLPSGIFYKETIEVLESGMVIHPEDLITEIGLAEKATGSLKGRIVLSEDAMLCTDLQRAVEVLNKKLTGKYKGGTGRGIGPTTAEFYGKTGFCIKDLIHKDWEKKFADKYKEIDKLFKAHGQSLARTEVPDFRQSKQKDKAVHRKIGSKKVFLERLSTARKEMIIRKLVTDTFFLMQEVFNDKNVGVVFEMAQAVGLDPWFGTRPDRTTTPTTLFGITYGTRYWKAEDVEDTIGVIKGIYMSSVGTRKLPTEANNDWSRWIQDKADEYGTTTKRPRDVCHLDLPLLEYNLRMAGVNSIAITHLDICRKDEKVKVCVGYKMGSKRVGYKPDEDYLRKVKPVYRQLPSWDMKEVSGVNDYKKLPKEAKDFIKFIEMETGMPVIMVSTGPGRDSLVNLT